MYCGGEPEQHHNTHILIVHKHIFTKHMHMLVTSLFMWCMSGVPRVFDGKMCAHDNLFMWCMSDVPRIFDDKTCARDELICMVHHM